MFGLEKSRAPQPLWQTQLDLPVDPQGYAFNPTIFRTSPGLICVYRHIGNDGTRTLRRCRLRDDFQPEGGFAIWSQELLALGTDVTWHADPRSFKWNNRHFVTFNTGHSEYPNNIYLVEVGSEGQPLSPPIRLVKTDGRHEIEKNWGFFEHEGTLYALYTLSPLTLLRIEMKGNEAHAHTIAKHDWQSESFEHAFGTLCGGASPVRHGDVFYVVAQSHIETAKGHVYAGTLLAFEAKPPFRPLAITPEPTFPLTPAEYQLRPPTKLNPKVDGCLYPCGAILRDKDQTLSITYGINDFRSGARHYSLENLVDFLRPLTIRRTSTTATPVAHDPTLRTFFWQPERTAQGDKADLVKAIFRFGNAGDSLQALLIAKLFGARSVNDATSGRRWLGVGSIAHRMQAHDILWGCGFKDIAPRLSPSEAATVQAYAVRGPLTRDYLARYGVDISKLTTYFDPGLLLTEIFPKEIAALRASAKPASGILYLPHYRDERRFKEIYGRRGLKVGSMDTELFDLCRHILEASLVVASSLHGIIFAEALGIPALLHRPPPEEFALKYQDYYLGTGRDAFPIIEEGENPANITPAPLPTIPKNWRETLPNLKDLHTNGILF